MTSSASGGSEIVREGRRAGIGDCGPSCLGDVSRRIDAAGPGFLKTAFFMIAKSAKFTTPSAFRSAMGSLV